MRMQGVTLVCGLAFCGCALLSAQSIGSAQKQAGSDAALLSTLTTRLSLSVEQQKAIASIMQQEGEKRVAMEASFAKNKPLPLTVLQERSANYDEETKEIEHVLRRQQRTELHRYVQVELPVERELNRLQKRYQLTDAQRMALQPILTSVAESSPLYPTCVSIGARQVLLGNGAVRLELNSDAKKVLTKEQWKKYQQNHPASITASCNFDQIPPVSQYSSINVSDITAGITH